MARFSMHTKPVTARLPPAVVAALEDIAEKEERTVSQVILRLVRERLQALGALPPDEGGGKEQSRLPRKRS